MALTRSLILAEGRRDRSPCAVLSVVNRLLRELGQPDMFVTVFYGVLDVGTRELVYVRAGHDRPLLLRDGHALPLPGAGTCLGILDGDEFRLAEEVVTLVPGDRLVLYTDGLTDVLDPDEQLYGRKRFASLALSYADRSPDALCMAVLSDLSNYRGDAEQYDDMTLLVLGVE
jgi:sigma-B regulation protein RsbU (phosphoserine phosphatase)